MKPSKQDRGRSKQGTDSSPSLSKFHEEKGGSSHSEGRVSAQVPIQPPNENPISSQSVLVLGTD